MEWEWWIGKAEEHAVDRDERIYRFGYIDIGMLMVGENPWFEREVMFPLNRARGDDRR